MRITHIYTSQALKENASFDLEERAFQHLVKALRMNSDDPVMMFNGDGYFYSGHLSDVGKKSARVCIKERRKAQSESSLACHLGQVISRGDRMDYAIQKSTELGVREITPLLSERCEVRLPKERQVKRIQHWQQVAISAAEQSGRASVPCIHPISDLNDWINSRPQDQLSLVLHHRHSQSLESVAHPTHVNLLIGPEGGLSQTEIEAAEATGFVATTLGPRVFRTETAPVAALSILQWLWGDLRHTSYTDINQDSSNE